MKSRTIYLKAVAALIVLFCGEFSYAQNLNTRISSPYSRYGLGDLQKNRLSQNMAMGGISMGLRERGFVNFANPASYTSLDTSSYGGPFVFETSVISSFTSLESANQNQVYNFTTLGYLKMGFPIFDWWKASIGLIPRSSVGYKIKDEQILDNIGKTEFYYEGTGGVNQFYMGHGFEIFPSLSVGANVIYNFGNINQIRSATFPDSTYIFDVRTRNSILPSDFSFDFGLQYYTTLKEKYNLTIGATFSPGMNLNAKRDILTERFTLGNTGVAIIEDTVQNISGEKGTISLPTSYGGGFTIGEEYKWLVGADVYIQDWSGYTSFGEVDSLKNSLDASLGFQITPDGLSSVAPYWKRVTYRLGARYSNTYLSIRENQLSEFGISFGVKLPMRKTRSTLNLGFELGQRGTLENDLLRERFGRISVAISVYEWWFYKRKFD